MCVRASASQRIPWSVLARNPHKGHVCETGSGRGKEGPREERRTVGMRGESRGHSQKMKAGQRREKNRSQKDDC